MKRYKDYDFVKIYDIVWIKVFIAIREDYQNKKTYEYVDAKLAAYFREITT